MPRVSLLAVLEVVSLLGSSLTAFKLFKESLYRDYPFFFLYFLFRIIYLSCVLALNVKSMTYYWFWVYTHPVVWILWILVIRELSGKIFEKYAGLRSLGRWIMYAGTVSALIISFVSFR